jgi:type VI protein secretion system component VasK
MDPKKVLDTLHKLGVPIAPRTAVIALVALPIVLLAGAWLWKRRARLLKLPGLRKREAPSGEAMFGISGNQLRSTWRRFMRTLPRTYRRSILSFDHFVVLGDASSGKSLVIDRYTDFRRQAKQFLGSHVFDSYIDLYIGSRTVVMELAASVLLDIGPKCRTALERLWRPLYRRCAPSVVLVVDIERLTQPDFDIVDYAERLRGKVNLLSGICKRALEVRVVLTHLDNLPGYEQFAQLCGEEKIPLFIPISPKPELSVESQLDAWVVHVRDHLGRALV